VLVGELNRGVNELLDKVQPDRIIIESSGNAFPFPIVMELKKNPRVYVDGVVMVVDCLNFEKIKDKSYVARDQAKYTDLIVLNKTGLVDEDKLYHVREEVNDLNPDTVKLETTDGVIYPHVLFGIPGAADKWQEIRTAGTEEHNHDLGMETFVWETEKVVELGKVDEVVKACKPNSFYRIKGILNTNKGWQLVNGVFGRLDWRELADFTGDKSQLVFIGPGIKQWETQVKEYLEKTTL
jgi:G3E family GTPase